MYLIINLQKNKRLVMDTFLAARGWPAKPLDSVQLREYPPLVKAFLFILTSNKTVATVLHPDGSAELMNRIMAR